MLGLPGDHTGWSVAQAGLVDRCIASGLSMFYNPTIPGEGMHRWNFLRPETSLVFAAGTTEMDLPDNFASLIEAPFYRESSSVTTFPVVVGLGEMSRLRQRYPEETGRPERVTVSPKTFSATTGQRYQLQVWPEPDEEYTLYLRYAVRMEALSETNLYPAGGAEHRETILQACLWAAQQREGCGEADHERLYKESLMTSIERDRQAGMPESLGYYGDKQSSHRSWSRRRSLPRNVDFEEGWPYE